MQSSLVLKVVILVVVLVALVLIMWIPKKYEEVTRNPIPTPTLTLSPGSPLPSLGLSGGLKKLSLPQDNASVATRDAFVEKLRSLAQAANAMTISQNCVLSPDIISLKSSSNLTFRNKDTLEHSLSITEEIRIMAGKETTTKAVFKGPGVYGITCDGPDIVGFIDLSE